MFQKKILAANSVLILLLMLSACGTKNPAKNPENLPKDIALKPTDAVSREAEQDELRKLLAEIEAAAEKTACTDADDWMFAPIGAKPCGGPRSYIALPKELKADLVPRIEAFMAKQAAFNKKYGLVSDCMLVAPPAAIECVEGKAVLKSGMSAGLRAE